MAAFKYFSDQNDATEQLTDIQPLPNMQFSESFPGIVGFRYDGFQKYVGVAADGRIMPVTRRIEYKQNPSLHECNAKCMNGRCNGVCECKCGGKNHGRGFFLSTFKHAA